MAKGFKHGGGGSAVSGGTLVVVAPVGVRATVSSDEKGKTYTKIVGSDGKATFSGITTGDWKITIASETQTASKVVTIATDYKETLAFFSATINVSYPTGSTCTATDGVTTLTAPDTSGTWECIVPNAGTWTITCTAEEKTKREMVEIATDGEEKRVTLSYTLYLYNLGDTCDAVTGGWVSNAKALDSSSTGAAAPSITYGADSMTISTTGTNYTAGIAHPANKIDVTNFNTINFKGAANATTGRCKICVWSDFGAYQTDNLAASVDLRTQTEAQIDVSGLTGKYYIGFGIGRGSSKDNSVTVKQFYLA